MTEIQQTIMFGIAVISPVLSGAAAWYGSKHAIELAIANIRKDVEYLRKDFDSDHGRLEKLSDFCHKRN